MEEMEQKERSKRINLFFIALLMTAVFICVFLFGYIEERSRVHLYSGVRDTIRLTADETASVYTDLRKAGCRTVNRVSYVSTYLNDEGCVYRISTYMGKIFTLYLSYTKVAAKIEKT